MQAAKVKILLFRPSNEDQSDPVDYEYLPESKPNSVPIEFASANIEDKPLPSFHESFCCEFFHCNPSMDYYSCNNLEFQTHGNDKLNENEFVVLLQSLMDE